MDMNYETESFLSNHSLKTEYYDSTTVAYAEHYSSEFVKEISNKTDYNETDLSDWRKNFWALFDEPYLRYNLGWTIALVVTYALIFLIGLVGNCMVILVVIRRPKMRTVTNLFVMNLAVADLLAILFCVPTELLWDIFIPWILGSVWCKAANYVIWVSLSTSAYSLVTISIDRCKAIHRPQAPPRGLSKRQALYIIGLIWSLSVTFTIPLTVIYVVDDDSLLPECDWNPAMENQFLQKIYYVVVFIFLFYCWPLILIFVSNIIIWWNVSKRKVPEQSASSARIHRMHRKSRQSVGKMLGIVTLVFLLSWLPHHFFWTYTWIMNKYISPKISDIILSLMPLLFISNSSINPVLYAFMSKKFRDAFKSLLPKWLPCVLQTANNLEKSSPSRETTTNDMAL